MNRTLLTLLAALGLILMAATDSRAGLSVGVSVGTGWGFHRIGHCYPSVSLGVSPGYFYRRGCDADYYAPAYYAPRPVDYEARPAYYAPRPVYFEPRPIYRATRYWVR